MSHPLAFHGFCTLALCMYALVSSMLSAAIEFSHRAARIDAFLAVVAGLLWPIVPFHPGFRLESGVMSAVLLGLAIGFSLGAMRFGDRGTRSIGITALTVLLLVFLAFLVRGYVDRDAFLSYWFGC